jgi:parvulin-like peptidyl-prolyl isomerase
MEDADHPFRLPTLVLTALLAVSLSAVAQSAQMPVVNPLSAAQTFAHVGDSSISHDEYNAAFNAATRAKFYHAKPPDAEIAAMQREVADQLVARLVLLREIKRRGLRPDAEAIQKQVAVYDQRYANSEPWKKNRALMLPALVERLEQDDLLEKIEKSVRDQVQPTEAQVNAYFASHREKFTEPEQMRVSVILLKVDPSANDATWKATEERAKALARRLRAGEDFAALARQYSAEASALQGGDMGYLHRGMLPEGSQDALAKLKVAEVSDPQRLLEGFAVFRLTDRKLAIPHSLDQVKVRARQLTQREQADLAWNTFVKDLKTSTPIQMDQSRFLPLAR